MAENWAALGILLANGVCDWKKGEILLLPTLCAGAAGIFWQILYAEAPLPALLFSMVPGAFLTGVGKLSGGRVGAGDGIVVWAAGIWTGFYGIFRVLVWALLLAAAAAAVLLMRKSRKKEIPFVPFLAAAFLAERMVAG
jgi:prepilin signal peptidase PulO-like enzyme (type II secretory pathway)